MHKTVCYNQPYSYTIYLPCTHVRMNMQAFMQARAHKHTHKWRIQFALMWLEWVK